MTSKQQLYDNSFLIKLSQYFHIVIKNRNLYPLFMKKLPYPTKSILLLLMLSICHIAIAQKINNVQEGSIKAPAGLKIDGKLTEWGAALQAYNKSTKLWYTLANDNQDIYLAIKSTDAANINKILAGGISFSINTAGKKKDKGAYVITFPVVTGAGGRGMGRGRRGGFGGNQDTPDSTAILEQHKQALATCKVISAIGFKDITDTLISIYNEYSIKAVANFDDKGNFVYELAIPFKMLEITAGNQTEIAYNIKVNGMQAGGGGNIKMVSLGGGGGRNGGGGGLSGFGGGFGGNDPDVDDMLTPTDFWGKYTLAMGN